MNWSGWIGSFLASIVRTLVVSFIMFLIGWYLVTKEFPPKASSVKKSFEQIQQLSQLSFKILEQQKRLQEKKSAGEEITAEDQAAMAELHKQRAQLGLTMFQPAPPQYAKGLSPEELAVKIEKLEGRLQALEEAAIRARGGTPGAPQPGAPQPGPAPAPAKK